MYKIKYDKEILESIVKNVFTYSDVCRQLGLNPHSGNLYTVHTKIDEYGIDTSHFTQKRTAKVISLVFY